MLKITQLTASIVLAAAASAYGQNVTTIDGHQYAESQFVLEAAHSPSCFSSHHDAANSSFVLDINGENSISNPPGCGYGLLTFVTLEIETGSTPTDFSTIQPVDLFLAGLGLFTEEGRGARARGYRRLSREQGQSIGALLVKPEEWGPLFGEMIWSANSLIIQREIHISSGGQPPDQPTPPTGAPKLVTPPPADPQTAADEMLYSGSRVLGNLSKKLGGTAGALMGKTTGTLKTLVDSANNYTGQGQSLEDAIRSAVIHNPGEAGTLRTEKDVRAAMTDVLWQAQEDLAIAGSPFSAARARQNLRVLTAFRGTLASPGATEAIADLDELGGEATRLEERGDLQLAEAPSESKRSFELAAEKRIEAGDGHKSVATQKFDEASEYEEAAAREASEMTTNLDKATSLDTEADRLQAEGKNEEADQKRLEAESARDDAAWNVFDGNVWVGMAKKSTEDGLEAWETSSDEYENAAGDAKKAGNEEEAAELLEQAGSMIDPAVLKPWLTELRETAEEFEEAGRQAEKAAQRYESAADLQDEAGNEDKAKQDRERAESTQKRAAGEYRTAADKYQERGDNDKAREARDKADKLDPPDAKP